MKYLIAIMLLSGCASKSFEMEELSKDVLKSHQGVEIDVKPLAKDAK